MTITRPSILLTVSLVITLLSARLSAELGTAVTGATWLLCACFVLRLEHLAQPLRVTVSGLAALAIALLWWVDSYGVADPASAWAWLLGWGPPTLAALVVARRPDQRVMVLRALAWIGALLGAAHAAEWLSGVVRAAVIFTNPNVSAAVLVGLLPCALVIKRRDERFGLAAVTLLGIGATGSRGGLLAVAVMTVVGILLHRGHRKVWLGALAVAFLLVPVAGQRLSKLSEDPHAYGRALWWRAAWQVAQDYPAGVGTRQFGWYGLRQRAEIQAPVYRYLRGEAGESAHSEWLQLAVDHSPLGFVLLLLCVGATMWRPRFRPESLAFAGLMVHAAVDGTWQSEMVRLILLVHAMALWRQGDALPWRVPSHLIMAPLVVWVLAAAPVGYAQWLERSALRDDRLASRRGTVNPQSLSLLRRAADTHRLDPDPLSALASISGRSEQWSRSFDAIEEAIVRAPARPQLRRQALALYARAMALGGGNTATALRRLHHAQVLIQLQPMHAADRFSFAQAALGLGYASPARAALETALKLEPNYRVAHLAIAGLKPLEAQTHLDMAAAIRARMLNRYCADPATECKNHLRRVMTRLELRLLGDLTEAKDRLPLLERFASYPRPPLAPWPGLD